MRDDPVGLDAKVAALRLAATYRSGPASIETIETHMSWVFLTPEHVYKLKKPVRADGLDFSTLERRRFFCIEELRLNRRLAAWVYLDVLPLRQDPSGELRVGGEGRTVDWLVVMRRLPAALMLDQLLAGGQARPEHLRQVAELLCAFYRGLPPACDDPVQYRRRLGGEIDEREAGLCNPDLGLDASQVRGVCFRLRLALQRHENALAARVRAGRIVEGHGDLRPEHVWLGTPVAIIDCLEFSRELRVLDSMDEVGFLALECERAGAPELGRALLSAAAQDCGDPLPVGLVDFYQGLRACVRGDIALSHLKEPRYRSAPVWRERAQHYLSLAALHAQRALGPA